MSLVGGLERHEIKHSIETEHWIENYGSAYGSYDEFATQMKTYEKRNMLVFD